MLISDTLRAHEFLDEAREVPALATGKQRQVDNSSFRRNVLAPDHSGQHQHQQGVRGASPEEVSHAGESRMSAHGAEPCLSLSPWPTPPSSSSSPSSSSPSSSSPPPSSPTSKMRPRKNRKRVNVWIGKFVKLRRIRDVQGLTIDPAELEQGSLYDLMLKNERKPLFVRPCLWTDLHSEVLNAQFLELPPCDTPAPTVPMDSPAGRFAQPSSVALLLSKNLTDLLSPRLRVRRHQFRLRTILDMCFPKKNLLLGFHTKPLEMYFNGVLHRGMCHTDVLWADSRNRGPVMAYISRDVMRQHRASIFGKPRQVNDNPNEVVKSLIRLRIAQITPADEAKDPYLVALFIAMAQQHFYDLEWGEFKSLARARGYVPSTAPKFHDVKLRILTGDNEQQLSVYTATVTAALLQSFHDARKNPFLDPSCDGAPVADAPFLKIEYTKIPAWPVLGFKERLGKALGRDIVGDFDENVMERWPEPVDTEPESETERLSSVMKRKSSDSDRESFVHSKATGYVVNGNMKRHRLS